MYDVLHCYNTALYKSRVHHGDRTNEIVRDIVLIALPQVLSSIQFQWNDDYSLLYYKKVYPQDFWLSMFRMSNWLQVNNQSVPYVIFPQRNSLIPSYITIDYRVIIMMIQKLYPVPNGRNPVQTARAAKLAARGLVGGSIEGIQQAQYENRLNLFKCFFNLDKKCFKSYSNNNNKYMFLAVQTDGSGLRVVYKRTEKDFPGILMYSIYCSLYIFCV